MSYQKKNFMRSVVAFLNFFKSCSKVSKSGFRAFLDYFRKSELFNIAPFDPFSRGHPAPGNRTSRTPKRPLLSHSGTPREVPRPAKNLPERPPEASRMCVLPSQPEFTDRRKSSSPTCALPLKDTQKTRAPA